MATPRKGKAKVKNTLPLRGQRTLKNKANKK